MKGELSGDFPAKFRFDISEPPPEAAIRTIDAPEFNFHGGIALGVLALAPSDYPLRAPYALQTEVTDYECNEDGSVCTEVRRECTDDGRCRDQTFQCTTRPCELVESWGDAELSEPFSLVSRGSCKGTTCYDVDSSCDSEHCHSDVYRCEFDASERLESSGDGGVTSCVMLGQSGDTSLMTADDLDWSASDYSIFYVTEDVSDSLLGPLKRGYNLMASPPLDEWLASTKCFFDNSVAAVASYNEDHGTNFNILDDAVSDLVDEQEQACGQTWNRIDDPLSESLTIELGAPGVAAIF